MKKADLSKFLPLVISGMLALCSGLSIAAEPLVFEGRYEYRTDAESLEMLGAHVCFFPSEAGTDRIPRADEDRRSAWFCFDNSDYAAHLLGFSLGARGNACGFQGIATIGVSDYRTYEGEGGGNDVAVLASVLKSSKPESLPCE